jgi:predicted AlkP superfamily phosphohydrolase/phosphomutase/tetratricopeptide (TPR) repeat protein
MPAGEKVLLIGLDAAEWQIIRPLLAAGLLPNLQSLLDRGVHGPLLSSPPLLSPMLWTSAITGKRPTRHRITGPFEPRPDRRGFQVASRFSRHAKTVWEILDENSLPTIAVNFPATHPAKSRCGTVVSNLFPLRPEAAAIDPPQLCDTLKNFVVQPGEIDAASLLSFVPQAAAIDAKTDRRLQAIAQVLANSATVHAVATWCLEHRPWRLAAICYTGLHQFSHLFMQFYPPRQSHIAQRDFELYHGVIPAAYRFHDLLLGRLLQLAGPEANVLLISDHGFHANHLRPPPTMPSDESLLAWHKEQGVLIMAGPGIKQSQKVSGANLLDIAPTILSLLDLPAGADMPGRSLIGEQLDRRISWEDASPPQTQPWNDADESVSHLLELGYIEQPDRHAESAIQRIERENRLNLAMAWLESGEPQQAIDLLEPYANVLPCGIALARAYGMANRIGDCRKLVEKLTAQAPQTPLGFLGLGLCDLAARNAASALEHFRRAEDSPSLNLAIGQAYLRMSRFEDAVRMLQSVLKNDPHHQLACEEMAAALLGDGLSADAEKFAEKAVELRPDRSRGHYLLGLARLKSNRAADAIVHLLQATKIDANFPAAHRRLSEAFNLIGDSHQSAEHQRLAQLALLHRRMARRATDTAR